LCGEKRCTMWGKTGAGQSCWLCVHC
jgi:hypothetical protein